MRFTISRMAASITILPMISLVLFGGLCCAAGYLYRDHQLVSNTRTLFHVDVIQQYAAGNYEVRTESGTSFPFNPCPKSSRLNLGRYAAITFEQQDGCKFVKYWLPENDSKGEIADVTR